MQNDSLPPTVASSDLDGVAGSAAGPTVYLSARGQDTAAVAEAVKAHLESQGCLVRHGGADVRTRSQCARHYGPLLHDCDVFIQLIGVDPGPLLSGDDGEDGFWSLQVWEAQEAAKRRKPARHYLLADDFCRAILPARLRPPHLIKKQERHRRKLAGSPKKVRQVRDADELMRVLPVIRLAGDAGEMQPTVAVPGFSENGHQTTAQVTEISHDSATADVPCPISPPVAIPADARPAAESKAEEPPAPMPALPTSAVQEALGVKDQEDLPGAISVEASQLPEIPLLSVILGNDVVRSRPDPVQPSELSRPAPPEARLLSHDAAGHHPSAPNTPHVLNTADQSVFAPLPEAPFKVEVRPVLHRLEISPLPAPAPAPAKRECASNTTLEVVSKKSPAALPPATSATVPDLSREDGEPVRESKASPAAHPSDKARPLVEVLFHETSPLAHSAQEVPVDAATTPPSGKALNGNSSNHDAAPGHPHTTALDPVAGNRAFSGTPPTQSADFDSKKTHVPADNEPEMQASPPWRIEIVVQAPMKLELCRAEGGQRVYLSPSVQERNRRPARRFSDWMRKRSVAHTSPWRPVRGRRAFDQPISQDDTMGPQDATEPAFIETLILPDKAPSRRYSRHVFGIFRFTDSVTVRRLSEASIKRPGIAIGGGAILVVVLFLLLMAFAGFFFDGHSMASSPAAAGTSQLAAPSRLEISAPLRNPIAPEQTKPVALKNSVPEPRTDIPAAAAIAKADSAATPAKEIEIKPAVIPTRSLDEQQRALESALEDAILAMRKDHAGAEVYVRKNEAVILELQRGIQELIPIRNGHEFSGSPQSLALSRCLASVHLLGGRRQAARNVLLDLRDTITATRAEGDPEIQLVDHLLRLTDAAVPAGEDPSVQTPMPLTPGEMEAVLTTFGPAR